MILENASVTFEQTGTGWTYYLIDYYDPTGETRTPEQDSPVFTRDVQGNYFETEKIYIAVSNHPILGDNAVPFMFDAVTGLPVIIGGSAGGDNTSGGNSNTIGGYTLQLTDPQPGQALTFFTLPNGKKVIINAPGAALDPITKASPDLDESVPSQPGSDPSAPENNVSGVAVWIQTATGKVLRLMGREDSTDWLFSATPNTVFDKWGQRLRQYFTLDAVLRAGARAFSDIFLGATANYHTEHRAGEPVIFRGIDHFDYDALGTPTLRYLAGYTPEGTYAVFINGERAFEIGPDRRVVFRSNVVQGDFDLYTRTVNYSNVPVADPAKVTRIPVTQYNPATQTEDTRFFSPGELCRWLLSQPELAGLGYADDDYETIETAILCRTVDTPDPTIEQPIDVPAAEFGQSISHSLNVPGSRILAKTYLPDGSPYDGVSYSYPDNSSFIVSAKPGVGIPADGIVVELQTKRSNG